MADVFVSYSREDQPVARRFATELERAGLSVWWDQALSPGVTFDQATEQALHESKAVLVLWSTRSVKSRWVRSEATQAERLGKLVPVTIEACDRPILFELSHTVDLSRWKGDTTEPQWIALLSHLRSLVTGEKPPAAQPPALRARPARARYFVMGAAALLLAAAAGWMLLRESSSPPAVPTKAGSGTAMEPPPNSVAVMPFINLSGDAEYEYFADGVSEELLNSLARVSGLQVSARTSSFSLKGTHDDVPTIGRKLNVAAVLEGSVRRDGKLVRITAQLINTANGYHLWSQNFDRKLTGILDLQTEVANAVTEALKVKLLPADSDRITVGSTKNDAAYDAYLRGRNLIRSGPNGPNYKIGLAALEESLRLDPGFAGAHLFYGGALLEYANTFLATSAEHDKTVADARRHVERALQLAPAVADAHVAVANQAFNAGDVAAASAAINRALELEPNNFSALLVFATINARNPSRQQAALDSVTHALRLDPLSPQAWRQHGIVLYFQLRHAEAEGSLRHALSLSPNHRITKYWLGLNEVLLGNATEGAQLCESIGGWEGGICLSIAQQKLGHEALARETLEKLKKEFGNDLACNYAGVYAQWGDETKSLEWLATAVKLKDPGLIELPADPLLVPLRSTPQFREIAAREAAAWQ